jgi:phosphoserine phosphatase
LPLFGEVGVSVAFNASAAAQAAATAAVDDEDLRGVIPVLDRLVTRSSQRHSSS